jgi:hypothetical protein
MGMSANYWPPADKAEMITRLRKAVDLGVAFFDTAEAYGPSHLALRRKRSLRASDVILSGAPRPYGGGGSAIRLCKIIRVVRFSTFSTVSDSKDKEWRPRRADRLRGPSPCVAVGAGQQHKVAGRTGR